MLNSSAAVPLYVQLKEKIEQAELENILFYPLEG